MCRSGIIAATAVALLLSISSYAQKTSLGLFNSLKGIGVSLELDKKAKEFNSFALYAEMFGIPTGRCSTPGVKFNWSHNFILRQFENDATVYSLYAGPGISCGYMRDFEVGERQSDARLKLTRNPGISAALSGSGGCRFAFKGRIALDLSFTADLGIFIRKDETLNNFDLNLYRNGLAQCFYPQLSILVFL